MDLLGSKTKNSSASQKFVEIQDIKGDVVVLKNSGLRAVCIASSINFELKGSDEQEALIGRYQAFLNSLDFPLQILISSRKLEIEPYLNNLDDLAKTQTNELLHSQTIEYMDFIKKFVGIADVMNKFFYVIIPYNPLGGEKEKFLDKIKYIIKPKEAAQKMTDEQFKEYRDQLMQRVNHVIGGLRAFEIKATLLNTKQLQKLFYKFYNPGRK